MIGFATLPEQVHRKTVKRGFDFTLLVVGEAGLGKSTLVNSLFLTELYKDRKIPSVESEFLHHCTFLLPNRVLCFKGHNKIQMLAITLLKRVTDCQVDYCLPRF